MSNSLTERECRRLRHICIEVGQPDRAEWLIQATATAVRSARAWYCANLPPPGKAQQAAEAFERSLRQARQHWEDCGEAGRQQLARTLIEAAARAGRPLTLEEHAVVHFSMADSDCVREVPIILGHLADAARATTIESPRQRTADLHAKQALADDIVARVCLTPGGLGISKYDPRGVARQVTKIGLAALARSVGLKPTSLDTVLKNATGKLRGRTMQKVASSNPK